MGESHDQGGALLMFQLMGCCVSYLQLNNSGDRKWSWSWHGKKSATETSLGNIDNLRAENII